MLLFNAITLVAIGLILNTFILSPALIFSVLYVWCQINRDVIVSFWFGVQVKVRTCLHSDKVLSASRICLYLWVDLYLMICP